MSEHLPLHGIQLVLSSLSNIGMWTVMEHDDAFSLFTLLFVLYPVMQVLKSFRVTVDDMSLHYLKSKSRGPLNFREHGQQHLTIGCVSFLSSWSRVSPLVFVWVQNGDTKWQHVPQCPTSSGVPRGGFKPLPPSKFRRPSKIMPNSTQLWKLKNCWIQDTNTPRCSEKRQ